MHCRPLLIWHPFLQLTPARFIILFMDKISDIALENTVTVKIDYEINSEVVGKNFRIIMDCLKQLKAAQDGYDGRFDKLEDRLTSVEKHSSNNVQQNGSSKDANDKGGISQKDKENILKMIKQLEGRTDKSEKNILDNIKDINLLNKDVIELKEGLGKLKNTGANEGNNGSNKGGIEFGSEAINNINKEMLRNRQETDKLKEQIEELNKQVNSIKEKLEKFIKDSMFSTKDNDNKESSGNNNQNSSGGGDISRAEFNELKQKVSIVQKKTAGLQLATDNLEKGQKQLQQSDQKINTEIDELKAFIKGLTNDLTNRNQNNDEQNISKADWTHLQKLLEQLRKDLQALKKEQNNQSKTSIEQESGSKGRFEKASYTQVKFRDDDKLKDLIARVDYLEKMMGSKNSIDHEGNKNQKLPLIKRPGKPRDSTHDKSSVKKDMHEVKNELQVWLNNYLANMKSKDNFEDLELKIQEIKNSLGKKADQEGMKKGLMFLESKINQLYLFLTEPDGEDAMIVRKGFNCLSCSKKVEKLRGKLGPHINWNNMTSTNYSPPKVGYSRHQGDSPDREDDL